MADDKNVDVYDDQGPDSSNSDARPSRETKKVLKFEKKPEPYEGDNLPDDGEPSNEDSESSEEKDASLGELLAALKSVLAGSKELGSEEAVEAVADVVEGLKKNSIVLKFAEKWNALPQEEQVRIASDFTLFENFIITVLPLGPLAKMPYDARSAFLKALLYYGVLKFNSSDHVANEKLIKKLQGSAKTRETVGLALVRGAAFLMGQGELGEIAHALVEIFTRNRTLAAKVRVHLHNRMMEEINEQERQNQNRSIPPAANNNEFFEKELSSRIRLEGDKTA
ncbi:MAG: hypothetical protein WCW30_01110 [Candidatus Gracilibacteria bacterium]